MVSKDVVPRGKGELRGGLSGDGGLQPFILPEVSKQPGEEWVPVPLHRGLSPGIFCLGEDGQEEESWREDQSPSISPFLWENKEGDFVPPAI